MTSARERALAKMRAKADVQVAVKNAAMTTTSPIFQTQMMPRPIEYESIPGDERIPRTTPSSPGFAPPVYRDDERVTTSPTPTRPSARERAMAKMREKADAAAAAARAQREANANVVVPTTPVFAPTIDATPSPLVGQPEVIPVSVFDDVMNGIQTGVDAVGAGVGIINDIAHPPATTTGMTARERAMARMRAKADAKVAAIQAQRAAEAANGGTAPPSTTTTSAAPSGFSWPLAIGVAGLAIQLMKK